MVSLMLLTDVHMNSQTAVEQVVAYLETAIAEHCPELVICLGDLFEDASRCRALGPGFRRRIRSLSAEWLFLYGNHDGSSPGKGGDEIGRQRFESVFGTAQPVIDLHGVRLLVLADQNPDAEWRAFVLEQAGPGTVILSHAPLGQDLLDRLEKKGCRYALSGHMHVLHKQTGSNGQLTQYSLAPFRFGGRHGESGGYAIAEFHENSMDITWCANHPPPLPAADQQVIGTMSSGFGPDTAAHLPNDPDCWQSAPPLVIGERSWAGGPLRLQHYQKQTLQWERHYADGFADSLTPMVVNEDGQEFLIIGGTWNKRDGRFCSLMVLDPYTGEERYCIEVIGVSAPPAIADGIMYVVGQWREIIAVELASGRELWRQRSQVDTVDTTELSWMDGYPGSGWSLCRAAVGKHVWTVNSRGDLFGYDRQTGKELFVYPRAVPCSDLLECSYSPTMSCAVRRAEISRDSDGCLLFAWNGKYVHDEAGKLL